MKAVRWLLVLSGLFLADRASAQGFIFPGSYGFGAVSVGGAVVARGKHFAYLRTTYAIGYASPSPYYLLPRSRVTLLYAYAPPPPAIVLLNTPRWDRDDLLDDRLDRPPQRQPPGEVQRPQPPDEPPLPGQPAGGFRPIQPDDRARAQRPIAPPPPRPEPAPFINPDNLPPLPIERPQADPLAEHARQLSLGKQAFAQGAAGRAAQHFRQATLVAPQVAMGHFLLGEALTALGKYRDAIAEIHEGLLLRPDWPAQSFRPRDLFDANQGGYADVLHALDEVLVAHGNDPVLLFLSAYHLWFDGRKDEARPLFLRAAAVAADRGDIERFLQALP